MSPRLFVAIELPGVVRDALRQVLAELRSRPGSEQVRWVDASAAHLTLKFLGETRDDLVPQLVAALRESCGVAPPLPLRRLHLGQVGVFPNARQPRVIWVAIESEVGDDALVRLHERIDNAAARLGFAREKRGFTPHLTLGRVRQGAAGADLGRLLGEPIAVPASAFTARTICLTSSTLHPSGAVYDRLFEVPLAAGE